MRGFAFNVYAKAQLFGLLLVYACFFEFVWAKALAHALFAVLFGDDYFKVVHLFAPFYLVVTVASCVSDSAAWSSFF